MRLRTLTLLLIFMLGLSDYASAAWTATTSANGPTHSIYYYASKNRIYASFDINGISYTGTQGDSWTNASSGLPPQKAVWDITSVGTTLFAATDSGVYKSTNDGSKWNAAFNGLGNLTDYHFAVSGNIIYVATDEAGLFYSSDNGASWKNMNGAGDIQFFITSVAASGNTVYAGTQYGKIYKTTDAGTTWENISKGIVVDVTSIALTASEIYAGTRGSGIYVSKDAGANWSPVNSGLNGDNLYVNDLLVYGNKLIAATRGGIIITENMGASWADISQGLTSKEILSLAADTKYMYAGEKDDKIFRRDLSEIKFPELLPPVLISPLNQSTGTDTTMTFTWNTSNGAVSYHFQLSLKPDFSTTLENRDGLKVTVQTVSELKTNTKYYWRVAANSADQQKKWSDAWYFVTKGPEIPLLAPVLVSPSSDTNKTIDIPVELKWTQAEGATSYSILIAADEEFNVSPLDSNDIKDTVYYARELKEHTVYYWKVGSVNDQGKNAFSETRMFKTGIRLSAEDGPVMVKDMEMSAYPNPANGLININVSTAAPGNINLTLTDISGKEVASVFSGYKESGSLNVSYNTSALSPGVYNLTLSSGIDKMTKKIVIVR